MIPQESLKAHRVITDWRATRRSLGAGIILPHMPLRLHTDPFPHVRHGLLCLQDHLHSDHPLSVEAVHDHRDLRDNGKVKSENGNVKCENRECTGIEGKNAKRVKS